jgi:hypothetical protein
LELIIFWKIFSQLKKEGPAPGLNMPGFTEKNKQTSELLNIFLLKLHKRGYGRMVAGLIQGISYFPDNIVDLIVRQFEEQG